MSLCRTVDLADHVVTYGADLARSMNHLDWFFGALSPTDAAGELQLHLTDGRPTRPSGVSPGLRDGPIELWHRDDELRMWHIAGGRARVTDGDFAITYAAGSHDPWRVLRHLLFSGLSWWFERRGAVLLHGAMIARDDDAALVLGETGQGKSTIALGALLSGWEVCSDDLVVIGGSSGDVRSFGIPKRPTVDAIFADSLGLPSDPVPNDARGRVMLSASTMSTGWRRVRLIVLAGHHDDDGELSPVTYSEGLAAVLEAYLEAERPEAVRRQLPLLATVAGLPAYRLSHTATPDRRLQRAADLFATAWSRVGDSG